MILVNIVLEKRLSRFFLCPLKKTAFIYPFMIPFLKWLICLADKAKTRIISDEELEIQ